ncbi:unnamed protein product [Moneuplotes crassus]|uniref:Uncharacterized protein n=2 Tax=Euplotes crassus TaxID=5936 RepID=A0AAD1U5V6_EUPCR|nr:unnamed protein product [Moneuplotes crassus]
MDHSSPRKKGSNLNRSTMVNPRLSLQSNSDSDDASPDPGKRIKLPEIILNKLVTTKASDAFTNIPGFKTTKSVTKRAKTEKKKSKRDYSVDSKIKKNILFQPINDKKSKAKVNTKVMEAWIEDTLTQAEHFEIPSVITKPSHKKPITRYGIDRLTLSKAGISDETIDRIYRSLFVHSVGFHELIKTCLQHTKNRFEHITSIWKVYSVLLEYSCKSDYKMLVDQVSIQNEERMKQMETDHNNKLEEMKEDERILKDEMNVMQKYSTVLEREKLDEKNFRIKLEEELLQNSKNHEEEVQLRLKFESKLNNMHSIHRDLGTKYRRALLDIETLQNTNELLNTKKIEIIQELNGIKTQFAEQENKLAYDKEKIIALEKENAIKVEQVQDLLIKTAQMQEKYDKLQYQYQLSLKNVSEQKLSIDVLKSQIQALKNEKTHLRQSEVESRMLKETFEDRLKDTTEELRSIKEVLQVSEREVLGFNEIRKEREERIDKLKNELESLKILHNRTDSNLAKTSIDLEKTLGQLETLREEYSQVVEKLKKINKARNEKINQLNNEQDLTDFLKKENQSLKDIIKERDSTICENEETIQSKDKQIHKMTSERITRDKSNALQMNQLNEKIISISGLLVEEQQLKEQWMDKYQKEQKEHSATNNILLSEKSTNKDLELKIKDVEIRLANAERTNGHYEKTLNNMQERANNFMSKYENSERDLKAKKHQIVQLTEQKEQLLKLKEDQASSHDEELTLIVTQHEMHYEDLLSYLTKIKTRSETLEKENEAISSKYNQRETEVANILNTGAERAAEVAKLNDQIKEMESDSNLGKIKELEEKLAKLKTAKDALEQKNIRLNVDLDKANERMKQIYKEYGFKQRNMDSRNEGEGYGYDESEEGQIESRSRDRGDISNGVSLGEGDVSGDVKIVSGREEEVEKERDEYVGKVDGEKQEEGEKVSGSKNLMNDGKINPTIEEAEETEEKESNKLPSGSKTESLPPDSTPESRGASNHSAKAINAHESEASLKQPSKEPEVKEVTFRSIKGSDRGSPVDLMIQGSHINKSQQSKVTKNTSNSSKKQDTGDKGTQARIHTKEQEIDADFELIRPIIEENLRQILANENQGSPPRNTSERSMPIAHEGSDANESRINYMKRELSQETYLPPEIQHTEPSEHLLPKNGQRGSVLQHYNNNNSPILSKNSIHHMSNHSTIITNSIRQELSHFGVGQRQHFNNSPSNLREFNQSAALTDEIQNTQRSDELLNTSTDMEPTQRQSVYQKGSPKKQQLPEKSQLKNRQNLLKVSQQPGYIDKEQAIIELPNREELMSNPRSREQSHQKVSRRRFNKKPEGTEGLMRSRYLEQEEEHKLEGYETYDNSETPNPTPYPSSTTKPMKIKVKKESERYGKLKLKSRPNIGPLIKAATSRDS